MHPEPIDAMETLSETSRRLEAAGYTDSFKAEAGGLRALRAGRSFAPEELRIDDVVRFEGQSDPGDAAVLFALRSKDGVQGLFVATYGVPQADVDLVEMVRRLGAAPDGEPSS